MERLNTFADFRGDFPKAEVSDGPPGAEVAAWIAGGLTRRRFTVAGVEGSDIEWIVHCASGAFRYRVFVWIDWDELDRWEVCCPSPVGWFRRLLGTTDREEHQRLLLALDATLREGPGVRALRWFAGYQMASVRDGYPWSSAPVVARHAEPGVTGSSDE